jgi:hypothetical protein
MGCFKTLLVRSTFVGVLIGLSMPTLAAGSLLEGTQAHPAFHGPVPEGSDVIFSTRFKRDDAVDAIRSFGATRIEWVYSDDEAFVGTLKAAAPWFGGALNSNEKLPTDDGMAKDFDGRTLINPRMKAWGGKWITTTNPQTQQALREHAKRYLALGANSIQVDDPLLQVQAAYEWGGDFNSTTLTAFTEYLRSYPNKVELERAGIKDLQGSYKDYLRDKQGIKDAGDYSKRAKSLPSNEIWLKFMRRSVANHFADFKTFLLQTAGRPVSLSMNLGILERPDERKWHFFLAPYADYAMAETPIASTSELQLRAATLRSLGVGYTPSLKPMGLLENRVAIATLYALGAQPVVPWDVYVGNDDKGMPKRFFGTAAEYSDLYRFVRSNAKLFDGMESAAIVGIPVPVDRFDNKATQALVDRLIRRRIPFAFVLAGGSERRYNLDAKRLQRFEALITANADADFSRDDLQAMSNSKVRRLDATTLPESALDAYMPFIAAGEAASLKIYPRGRPGAATSELVLHLVDEARGAPRADDDSTCRRRIAVRTSHLGGRDIKAATWYSQDGSKRLELTKSHKEVLFTVPQCALWGVVALQL